jgi:hypothetical protein
LFAEPAVIARRTWRKYFCRRKPSLGEFIRCKPIGSTKNLLFCGVALTLRGLINDFMVERRVRGDIFHGRHDR